MNPPIPPQSNSTQADPGLAPDELAQKIARLPKPTRDMINLMLDDALPYRVILDELAETGGGLTAQTLAHWVQTGHQQHLHNRQTIDTAKTQAEFAADLLHELGQIDPTAVHRACLVIAGGQIFNAIVEYGDEALRKMLHTQPASYLAALNILCRLATFQTNLTMLA